MISSFRKKVQVIRQKHDGEYIDGRWVPGPVNDDTVIFDIYASVQEPGAWGSPRQMEPLPEGRRASDMVVLFTDTELFTAEVSLAKNADIVVFNDERYEVFSVAFWNNKLRKHYKVTLVKESQ